jgi:hypothetical protein
LSACIVNTVGCSASSTEFVAGAYKHGVKLHIAQKLREATLENHLCEVDLRFGTHLTSISQRKALKAGSWIEHVSRRPCVSKTSGARSSKA